MHIVCLPLQYWCFGGFRLRCYSTNNIILLAQARFSSPCQTSPSFIVRDTWLPPPPVLLRPAPVWFLVYLRQVSLWVQPYSGVSTPDETMPLRLLWGKERIEEELLGLRFTISPNSFFQASSDSRFVSHYECQCAWFCFCACCSEKRQQPYCLHRRWTYPVRLFATVCQSVTVF